jgi:hypothetical protein
VALGRLVLAWGVVGVWLAAWALVERRAATTRTGSVGQAGWVAGEALLLALFGGLWFATLGSGAWGLVFVLVGGLIEWPIRSLRSLARVGRIVAAGGLLRWILGA